MTNNKNSIEQDSFSGSIAAFFATLGSAVGLGNIWMFPYITGENGGGAFLLIYLGCVFSVGLPILIAEYALGRRARSNTVAAYEKLGGSAKWQIPGWMGVVSSFFILFFYTAVAGWTYYYFYLSLVGSFQGVTQEGAKNTFAAMSSSSFLSVSFQWIVVFCTAGIIFLGVRRGIESVTKRLMPLLFVLLILCVIQALRLPNSFEGVKFLFVADFSKLTSNSILIALGLAFFKLSLGLGSMSTYASYFQSNTNLMRNALQVVLADTMVSMLAGLAIFPAVFSFGMEPNSGPGLLFITVPMIFKQMPLGDLLLVIFFFLSASAATMAIISMIEVPVAYLIGSWQLSRKKATFITSLIVILVGVLAALSATPDSLIGNLKPMGKTFFDWFNFLSSSLFMPLGGLACAILMGWCVNKSILKDELTNYGTLELGNKWIIYLFILRYISPGLVIVIFLNALGIVNLK